MKKKILVLLAFIMSMVSAQAADWQFVETNNPNLSLYIDLDSIKKTDNQEYLYAIKFTDGKTPERVAYIRSDASMNYIGVIYVNDYSDDTYRPKAVFANPRVFMKPVTEDSFLASVHNFVIAGTNVRSDEKTASNEVEEKELAEQDFNEKASVDVDEEVAEQKPALRENAAPSEDEIKNVAYVVQPSVQQKESTAQNLKEYVSQLGCELNENWNPPKSGKNSQAIIIITIGKDGGFYGYDFAKSSGDEPTDRSILSAVQKTAPFAKFPKVNNKNADKLKFQFVFDYQKFKKSVE